MGETIIIWRTGQAPLRVRGEVIAEQESSPNNAHPRFQATGVWSRARVIRTASGKYVAAVSHFTQWQGSHDTDEAAVFPELIPAVDWLASRIPHFLLQDVIEELGEDAVSENID